MIEAFRDNGLNTLDHNAEINVSRLETILSSIYYQLNKRLPTTHQINVDQSIGLLLNFMVATYDRYEAEERCTLQAEIIGNTSSVVWAVLNVNKCFRTMDKDMV